MKLHVLGVSGPFPESGGATSGYLLESADLSPDDLKIVKELENECSSES